MSQGLSVSDVVNVSIVMTPTAAAVRNFGALLVLGSSSVIDTNERIRSYTTLSAVANDFGTTAPEYLAAVNFFSQSPQPALLYLGRWAQTASSGVLHGARLSTSQQAIANFQAITNGGFNITIDGTVKNITGLNFSGAANLNAVAAIIATALTTANVIWGANNQRFDIISKTTGATSTVSYASAGTGTDVSTLLGLTAASGASAPVPGIPAETLLSAVTQMANISTDWYGLAIAAIGLTDADQIAVAAFIEAASPSRIFGITTQASATLDPTSTTDLAYVLSAAKYRRTFTQYSTSSPYAVTSMYGRAFTVDFTGNRTTITLKFKQEPGITAETLTETQAATLKAKKCNVFVNYNNSTAIIQEGQMTDGSFFDEVHGLDYLQNDVQTAVYNLLYTSPTKVPQTDAGANLIATTISARLAQGVANGLIAPGVWNSPGFGALTQGDVLGKGYYVYTPPVSSQSQADREARKAVTNQCAIKLAGAVHSANVIINVNR
jgi:hypothetical protein